MPINKKRKKGFSFSDFAKEAKKPPKASLRPKQRSKYVGRVHLLSLGDYLANIYKHNEVATQSLRASDIKIAEMVMTEYADYKSLIEKWRRRSIEEVVFFRNFYNKGDLTKKVPPAVLSRRYNAQGVVLTSDRTDSSTDGLEEWTKKKESYYTAHQIIRYGGLENVPKFIQEYDWFWDSPDKEDLKQLEADITEITNRSEAMKRRHEEKKKGKK